MRKKRAALHVYLKNHIRKDGTTPGGIDARYRFEVHSIRQTYRVDRQGYARFQWIVELTQRIAEYFNSSCSSLAHDSSEGGDRPDYYFRGGCTLIIDAESGQVLYSIKKPLDAERRKLQRQYMAEWQGLIAARFAEPFAVLHRHQESQAEYGASATLSDLPSTNPQPFNKWFRIQDMEAQFQSFFQEHYGFDSDNHVRTPAIQHLGGNQPFDTSVLPESAIRSTSTVSRSASFYGKSLRRALPLRLLWCLTTRATSAAHWSKR